MMRRCVILVLMLMLVLIIEQRLQSYPGRRDLANSECRMRRCPREKILHTARREEKRRTEFALKAIRARIGFFSQKEFEE